VRVVLDACVLYPPTLRDLLLTLAAFDAFEPRWSPEILDELERNVLADHPDIDPRRFRSHTIAAMTAAFPDATGRDSSKDLAPVVGVHRNDQHVAQLAIATGSDTIVTQNLRHFPNRALAKHNLRAVSPGTLITEINHDEPSLIDHALGSLAQRWKNPSRTVSEILDLLEVHPTMATPIRTIRPRHAPAPPEHTDA
jgi:hypothetical protein